MHVILEPKCHRSCSVAGEMIKETAAKSCREQEQEFKSQNKTCKNSTEEVNVIAVKKNPKTHKRCLSQVNKQHNIQYVYVILKFVNGCCSCSLAHI